MKKPMWPLVLVVLGFGLMAICISLLVWGDLSETAHTWALIGQSFGVGVGSIGLGILYATRK